MSMVHASRGRLAPGSPHLRSEVAIVTGLGAGAVRRRRRLGARWARTTRLIRKHIEHVVPGFHAFEERVAAAGRVHPAQRAARLAHVHHRRPARRSFTVNPPDTVEVPPGPPAAADGALARPVQHHRLRPRRPLPRHQGRPARGVRQHRRPRATWACATATWSTWSACGTDGERRAAGFRVVDYATPRGCAAAYFPEANVLVPLDSTAEGSNTPDVQVDRHPPRTGPDPLRTPDRQRHDRPDVTRRSRRVGQTPQPGAAASAARIASTGAARPGHQLDLGRGLVQQHQRPAEHRSPGRADRRASAVGHGS